MPGNRLFKEATEAEAYVNTINPKLSCKVATTENIELSGTKIIDGVSVGVGVRVLVKDQTTGSENGIYICRSAAWTRSEDMNSNETCRPNSFVFIEEGSNNVDKMFQLITDGTITLDTTNLTFEEYGGSGSSVLSSFVNGSNNRILTATGTDGMYAEEKLTFDGSELSLMGALTASEDITAFASDKRLKTNVEIIEEPLKKINTLSGFTYDWSMEQCMKAGFTPKDLRQVGVFAQDVQSVIPEAVKPAPFDQADGKSKSGNNYLTVQYDKIVPLLIEGIKTQDKKIQCLQSQINELKNKAL